MAITSFKMHPPPPTSLGIDFISYKILVYVVSDAININYVLVLLCRIARELNLLSVMVLIRKSLQSLHTAEAMLSCAR